MQGIRMNIYFKDKDVLDRLSKEENKSEFTDRAVKFYIENADIIPSINEKLSTLSAFLLGKISK